MKNSSIISALHTSAKRPLCSLRQTYHGAPIAKNIPRSPQRTSRGIWNFKFLCSVVPFDTPNVAAVCDKPPCIRKGCSLLFQNQSPVMQMPLCQLTRRYYLFQNQSPVMQMPLCQLTRRHYLFQNQSPVMQMPLCQLTRRHYCYRTLCDVWQTIKCATRCTERIAYPDMVGKAENTEGPKHR